MKILITPHDIIERALWQRYEYYILEDKSQEEIEKIITENEEFVISERDALIIDLLKCIETDNLSHRFNQNILHILNIKSTEVEVDKNKKTFAVRKNLMIDELSKFMKNFPSSWKPPINYKNSKEELVKYINSISKKLESAKIIEVEFQGNTIEYIQVNHVKKMLNFNH